MEDPYSKLADDFLSHQATLRGVVRQTLVTRQLAAHMAESPARVADVGGGTGHQAVPLARSGHEVTILDASQEMLRRAGEALLLEKKDVRARVRLVQGRGVLMYLDDSGPLVSALVALARPGGVVSVLTKNADTLAMRSALEGPATGKRYVRSARTETGVASGP